MTIVLVILILFSFNRDIQRIHASYNAERNQHNQPQVGLTKYLQTGDFVRAMFENWKSELFEIGIFTVLAILLREKGSPESKPVAARIRKPRLNDNLH